MTKPLLILISGPYMSGTNGDEAAIADAIRTLLEQPALRAEYGANGRRRAEELFSWQPVAKQYSDLLLYLSGLKERPDFTQNIV